MQIFTKEYWKDSLANFKNVKSIVLMSIFMALTLVVGGLCGLNPIKVFDRTISLNFIFWPIVAILFGPLPTMILAGVVDVLIYFIFPTGYPFYLGYTLTQMLMGFICGLVFYKTKISVLKILIFSFILDIGIHVGIESFFMADIMKWNSEALLTYMYAGAIKNIIMVPIETAVLVAILIPLLKVMKIFNLVDEEQEKIKVF